MSDAFLIARNPDPQARLPYLLHLPVPGGPLLLATREAWPATRDVYCHELAAWPEGAEIIEEVPVVQCRRRGAAVDLSLARRTRRRSQFIFTHKGDRPLIFWRSERTTRTARPGLRVPTARGLERSLCIAIDARERYAWRFHDKPVETERRRLPVGDYGVFHDDQLIASVERKRADEFAKDAMQGRLGMAMAELAAMPRGALIIEGRLSDVVKAATAGNVRSGWMMNVLAALQVEYPTVPIVFAETSKLASDLAYRWLAASLNQARSPQGSLFERLRLQHEASDEQPEFASKPGDAPTQRATGHARRDAPLDAASRKAEAMEMARNGTVWTGPAYAERFGVSRATALLDLHALADDGMLRREGRVRGLRFLTT